MNEYIIEDNIALTPPSRGGAGAGNKSPLRAALESMKVGQSLVCEKKKTAIATSVGKQMGRKYVSRVQEDKSKVRIFRLS